MKKSLRLRIVKALIPCFSLLLIASVFTEINAQNVTGKVFRDFDANGQQTTTNPIEPGVGGVTVKAFKADGTQAGSTSVTAADGSYSITVGTTSQVRIEFSNFPSSYFAGPKGTGSGTSVQFVNGGSTTSLGINYPSDFCGTTNPSLVTPCYENGTPLNGGTSANDPFIVSVPYTPTGDGSTTSENTYLAKGSEVGATWGMAYQRKTKFLFASALLKRHSGFGSGGPGAIYKVDNSGATPVTTLFVDLNADLGISVGTDPRNQAIPAEALSTDKTLPNHDATAFGLVGKMSLGDIDISDDEKTLWVINTFDRKLYELPIGSPAVKPTTKTAHTLPDPGCTNGVFRPWAVKFWRGKVYVGGVCTAENSGTTADLKAYIYSFTPGDANPNNFTEVYNFPLNYSRGFTSISSATDKTSAAWKPWIAQWSQITNPLPGAATYGQTICPQPMLSDIEFDVDGSIIVGFMDRAGHQLGNNNYSPTVTDTKTYEGTSAGDILRIGLKADGTYALESNGTVNGVISGGTNQTPAQGPNGGEFYWQDMYTKNANKNFPDGVAGGGHQEISLGGLALLAGKNEVAETVFDPVAAFRAGGVRWFDNTTGQAPRGYQVFGTDASSGSTFGKANGLGDLELLCANQPIEVGNRLWNDINKDGIQDAGEPSLTGVTVELWKAGTKISTTTTDATTGEYYFTGLDANTAYEIRIPNVNGGAKQTKLLGFEPTQTDASANAKDAIDSDASVLFSNTYASIVFITGNAGENNHTLDAGFKCIAPVAKPNGANVAICEPTTTFDLPDAKTGTEPETWSVFTSPANPAAVINATSGVVTGMTTNGKYVFLLTSTKTGCVDTVSITRNTLPVAGADQTLCSPLTTATVNIASAGQVWSIVSKPTGATPTVAADGKVAGLTVDGVYTLRLTQGDCFEEMQILRKAKPNAGTDKIICAPETTASLGIPSGTDTWGVVANPANPSPATILPDFGDISGMTNAGVYQFTLTSNGCTDTVKVTKNAGVTVTTANVSTCLGGNLSLSATSLNAGVTYLWSGPSNFTSNQQNPSIANVTDANKGKYIVTVTDGICSASATSTVTFNTISTSLIAGKLNYCVGETIVLRTFTPEVGYTYDWTGPNGFSSMNTLNISIPTTPDKAQQGLYTMTINDPNGCSAVTTLNITISECLSIGNLVWNDANNDGLNNNGETGVASIPVKLYKSQMAGSVPTDLPDGAAIQTTTTDANGKYLFSGLIPGYYIVEIEAPTGFKSSTGTIGSATGAYEPIVGTPNNDINNDDDGTTVTGQIIRTKAVELGNYTEPTDDGDATVNTDADKNSNLTIDFGVFKPAQLGDFVWSDTNRNGVQDAGELGVANIQVKLYSGANTTPVATTTTDANGKYLFDYLPAGTYTVEFVKSSIGAGNSFSPLVGTSDVSKDSNADPATGKSSLITLTAGESNLTIDAGISGDCPGSTVGTITAPSLCVGQTLTMRATSSDPNATYAWTSTNNFTATTQEVVLPNLATTNSGTYTVLITNSNACTSALTANVVVNPKPTVSVTNIEICEGTTGKLTATGATTYAWSGPNLFSATSAEVTVANAGIYTVIGTLNGCTANAKASVTVSPIPVPTATGAAICLGGSGTISVLPAGMTYAWAGPNNFTSTQQTVSITNATASNQGVYTVTLTNAKGCTAATTVNVTVGSALTVTPTSNSPVCTGSRLELSITGGTGAKYLWTSPSGFTTTMQNPFTQNSTSADNGVWTVAVENADGCKGTGSVNVTINPALTGVTATASAPTCAGGNISLTSTPSGAKSYEWSGTPTFTSTVQNPTITSPTAGDYTYTVKVTDANGCTAQATASTTIFATPTATVTSNSPICFGQDIQLGVTTNGTKFAWSGPNGFASTSQSPIITVANASKAGVYTVVVTNDNSCAVTATTSVSVNAQLNGGNDLSICSPVSTAQLTLIDGATWTADATNPAPATINNTTGIASGLVNAGTYVFYVTNTGGCKDTVNVYINAKLDAGDDKVICSPKSTAKLLALNTGQTWKYFANGSTLPTPTIDNQGNISGMTQDGTYLFILEQTADKYCGDTVAVIRKPAPNAGNDLLGNNGGICEPKTTAKLPASGANQTWSVASNSLGFGTVTIDATGAISNMNANGIYQFVLTQGECTDTVKVERSAKPNAGIDKVFCGDSTNYKLPNALQGTAWSSIATNPGSVQISPITGEIIGMTVAGDYYFVLMNTVGCSDTVKVTRKAIPAFDVQTQQATCTVGTPNSDAKLIVSGFDSANKYDYSEGTTYTGTKTFATAVVIPSDGILANNLANPTTDKSYTLRIFNSNGCFTDKTVVLKTRVCECKPDVCVPFTMKKVTR